MNKIEDRISKLEEKFDLLEKKKKPYSSMTVTTGDPQLNIDHFNKMLSGKASNNHTDGYMNGTIIPNPEKVNAGVEATTKAVGTIAAASPDGASSLSTGGEASGGEGGGCCEGLEEATHAQFAKPEGDRVTSYNNALAYANRFGKPFIYGYTNRRYNGKFFAFPQPIKCVKDVADCEREFRNRYKDCDVMYVAYPKSARADHDVKQNAYDPVTKNEALELDEAKRYVRRYYIKPQDIFCSNKAEILKALIDLDDADCTVYTLNNLGDIKDVSKLTNDDIIYSYKDGILYDKNFVKVMDYDLYIKHEEERDNINPDQVSDRKFNDVYDDRMTDQTVVEEVEGNSMEELTIIEDYELKEDKMFVGKLKGKFKANPDMAYVELPEGLHLIPQDVVVKELDRLEPGEKFTVGYITPLYFYKELWDKCTVFKCTELSGYTGIDWSDTSEETTDMSDIDDRPVGADHGKLDIALGVQKSVSYNLTNKVVDQSVTDSDKNNVGTILYYPETGTKPKVTYYVDLKKGDGFIEASKEMLEETLFKKLRELLSDKKTDIDIKLNIRKQLGIDNDTRADMAFDSQYGRSRYADDTKLRPQVRALYVSQVYYLKTQYYSLGVRLAEELKEDHELDLEFDDVNVYGESLHEGKVVGGTCCICGEEIDGYGNNPEPYKHDGRCCDACNWKFVIPARFELMQKGNIADSNIDDDEEESED